jgi:hypothetical protein
MYEYTFICTYICQVTPSLCQKLCHKALDDFHPGLILARFCFVRARASACECGCMKYDTKDTTVHSRRRECHRKQMHVISPSLNKMKSCSDHVKRVPLQGCPKSECMLTWVRMQWVHWTNCGLCPLLVVSCGDTGLGLFTLTVSSPRMDCRCTRTIKGHQASATPPAKRTNYELPTEPQLQLMPVVWVGMGSWREVQHPKRIYSFSIHIFIDGLWYTRLYWLYTMF